MSEEKMQKFNGWKVRSVWDEEREEWWLSVVDVVGVLTEQADVLKARKYWNKLKQRIKDLERQLKEKEKEIEKKNKQLADEREKIEILKKSLHIFMQPRE